jgi:hypothetical protein
MAYQIRPLSFGEILDRALRVVLDNALLLIPIAAIVYVPETLLLSIGPRFGLVVLLLMLFVFPVVQAAMAIAVAEIYLDRPISIGRAYFSAWDIYLPFLGTYFFLYLILLAVMIPVGVLVGIAGAAKDASGAASALIVLLIGFPLVFYFAMRWSLIGPIMVVENKFSRSALVRSGELVSGVWWRTLGILLAAGLIVRVPVLVLTMIWHSIPILGSILTGLAASVGWAYSHTVIVVYYFDRRCRVEDFDLLRLAEQIRSEAQAGAPAPSGASTVG